MFVRTPFTCASVVTQSKQLQFPSLSDDVAEFITAFLDPSPSIRILRASTYESIHLLQRWCTLVECSVPRIEWLNAVANAAEDGRSEVVATLHSFRPEWYFSIRALEIAAAHGHLDLAKWMYANRPYASFTYTCMNKAAKGGHLQTIQWLHLLGDDIGGGATHDAMDNACTGGHLELVQWLHQNRSEGCTTSAMDGAATNGHMDVLEWLEENRKEGFTIEAMIGAALNGHIHILEWLSTRKTKRGPKTSTRMLELAARNGHIETIKWLLAHREEKLVKTKAIEEAASRDQLETVQFLYERVSAYKQKQVIKELLRRSEYRTGVNVLRWLLPKTPSQHISVGLGLDQCAYDGDLDCIRVLSEHYPKVLERNKRAMLSIAANRGQMHVVAHLVGVLQDDVEAYDRLEMVKGLHALHPDANTDHVRDAAIRDADIETLSFLLETRKADAISCAREAAVYGHLEMIQFLLKTETISSTKVIMDVAAAYGHMNVVKWLHENRDDGCTEDALDDACHHGHLPVVKWLHANRSEGCTQEAMDGAAGSGNLDIVKFLHENRSEGCTIEAMKQASMFGFLDVVQWLHENRSEGCDHQAMDLAIRLGRLDVVKFLNENRTEGCSESAIDLAALNGHLNILVYLHRNRPERYSASTIQTSERAHRDAVTRWLKKHNPDFSKCRECKRELKSSKKRRRE